MHWCSSQILRFLELIHHKLDVNLHCKFWMFEKKILGKICNLTDNVIFVKFWIFVVKP